ncbi:MAG: hypothetical protein AB7N70_13945 [Dehalococcoidia bacterium]
MTYALKNRLPYVTMVPNETDAWSRDWTDELEDGDAIDASVWEVPTGLSAGVASKSGAYTTQWFTTSDLGEFTLVDQITTTAGRILRRSLIVAVIESK